MRAPGTVLAALVSLGFVTNAGAWTAATRVVMVDDAIKLMPPSLRTVLEHRRNDVRRGMLEPMTQEDAAGHRPPWDGGTLPASVDGAARDLVSGSETRVSFHDVARRFGPCRIDDGGDRHLGLARAHDAYRGQRRAIVRQIEQAHREFSCADELQRFGH